MFSRAHGSNFHWLRNHTGTSRFSWSWVYPWFGRDPFSCAKVEWDAHHRDRLCDGLCSRAFHSTVTRFLEVSKLYDLPSISQSSWFCRVSLFSHLLLICACTYLCQEKEDFPNTGKTWVRFPGLPSLKPEGWYLVTEWNNSETIKSFGKSNNVNVRLG